MFSIYSGDINLLSLFVFLDLMLFIACEIW